LNIEAIKRYVALEDVVSELERQLAGHKKDAEELEQSIMQDFVDDGVQSINLAGRTVFLKEDLFVSPSVAENGRRAVAEALIAAGYKELVEANYNANSLTALCRDLIDIKRSEAEELGEIFDDLGSALPEQLRATLRVTQRFKIQSLKAETKKGKGKRSE
jgi:hypothetical protein